MQYRFLTLAALASGAAADFLVFCGEYANGIDGAGSGVNCMFYNNPPSCDDMNSQTKHYHADDVSVGKCGGIRCEGCDGGTNVAGWAISELEINDEQGCDPSTLHWGDAGSDPHFTIYSNNVDVWIEDLAGANIGSCTYPPSADAQILQCSDGLGNGAWKHHFSCTAAMYPLDSN